MVGQLSGAGKTCKSRELLQESLTHLNKLGMLAAGGDWEEPLALALHKHPFQAVPSEQLSRVRFRALT